jgi:lactoylglutathione lyase
MCWVTINVKDLERSVQFYTETVGLTEERRIAPLPGTEIVFLRAGETQVELIKNDKNPDPQFGKDISLGFEVDSVDDLKSELEELDGLEIEGPFQPNPRVKFFYILDPDGVKIQFVENVKE